MVARETEMKNLDWKVNLLVALMAIGAILLLLRIAGLI